MATFTTNLTFSSLGRLESSEFGTVSIAGKRGSTLSFAPGDNTLTGDSNANTADVMSYDLTLFSTNALRFSGVTQFNLGAGADVLDLGVRGANAGSPYTLAVTGRGGSGDDLIHSGTGNDSLSGESTALIALAASNNDRIFGNNGNDFIYGDFQNAALASVQTLNFGNDDLRGGVGNDTIFGDSEDTSLIGGSILNAGDDSISGGDGTDTLVGDSAGTVTNLVGALSFGDDTINGGAGTDTIYGDSNSSLGLIGGGNDTINGGAGNDQLFGDTAAPVNSALTADRFVFSAGSGTDTITSFQTGEIGPVDSGGDIIDVSAYGVTGIGQLNLSTSGGNTTVTGATLGTDSIIVTGTTGLDSSEFDFA